MAPEGRDDGAVRGEILWTPAADARATTRIGAFLDWLARTAGLHFEGYRRSLAVVGRRPRRVLGSRSPSGRRALARPRRRRRSAERAMPGARVVPRRHAELRRARARRGGDAARRRRGRRARARPAPPSELTWAELADAVARCRAGLRAARRRPRRPRRGVPAEHPGDASSRSWPPPASARSGRRARRSSAPARSSTASRRSSRSCCSRSTATATARRSSTSAPRSPRSRPRSRPLRHTVHVLVPGRGRRRLERAARRARAARVRAGAVRPSALRALQLGHDRAAQGDRARPRRHHRRAPEDARAAPRPRRRRPLLLVHHHRLDDVELPGVGPARRRDDRAVRRRSRRARPRRRSGGSRPTPASTCSA